MIKYKRANLAMSTHAKAVISLLNSYAKHPMGGGEALSDYTLANLHSALSARSDYIAILAFDGERAIGLCNCFEAFSTFACKPILNIHDVYVEEEYRGQGIAPKMMQKAEQIALDKGCCKVTLEVLSENSAAKGSYLASGYTPYQLNEQHGHAEFWQKKIS